jgi:hypothetical protein
MLNDGPTGTRGYRRVIIGPDHPYVAGGLPMDAPGVGLGQNDGFMMRDSVVHEVDAVRFLLERLRQRADGAEAEQVNACLDAGVPVLCEEPLTTGRPAMTSRECWRVGSTGARCWSRTGAVTLCFPQAAVACGRTTTGSVRGSRLPGCAGVNDLSGQQQFILAALKERSSVRYVC